MNVMHWTYESCLSTVEVVPNLSARAESTSERRLSAALWCAGLAAFSLMYAPQGLLPQIARETSSSASQVSLLVSAATLGLAASVLPWAWLSDRIGRRTAMRVAAAGAALTAVTVPWLSSFDALLAGRLVQGAALGGIPALAIALLHETSVPTRTAALAGSYVAATSVGGLTGRLVVTPIADHLGWRMSLTVLGAVVVMLMAAVIALLPPANSAAAQEPSAGAVLRHLRDPGMLVLFGIGGTLIGGMVAVFNYLPFRLEAPPYSLTPAVVSLVFLAYLGGTIGSRAAGWLSGRIGPPAVLGIAGGLLAAGAAVTLAHSLIFVVVGVVTLTSGLFIGHAVASHLVGVRASVGRAQASALYNISYYSGSSVFGWIGGVAWLAAGWHGVAALVVTLGIVAVLLAFRAHAGGSIKANRREEILCASA
jgi:MFS transporter, YNFM family, putative membrane transport protein